jgi:hypothetical protein
MRWTLGSAHSMSMGSPVSLSQRQNPTKPSAASASRAWVRRGPVEAARMASMRWTLSAPGGCGSSNKARRLRIIDFLIVVATWAANCIQVEIPNQGRPNDEDSIRILGKDRSRNPEAHPQFRHLPLEFLE